MPPRLLDLFCGAGGCSMGYARAGFEVVGVDLHPQPHYPFPFLQADALAYAAAHGSTFDVIHASPPCQAYSRTRKILEGKGIPNRHPDLVAPTRDLLQRLGKPYIIENVPGAPLQDPITLCGTQFGLRVYRHRLFESSITLTAPAHVPHQGTTGSHRGYSKDTPFITVGGHNYNFAQGTAAMDVPWMTRDELSQAIPPAYTEYLGRQILDALGVVSSASEAPR